MAKLIGGIVAVRWDSCDDPSEVCLETSEDRYLVTNIEQCEDLLEYVGRQVEVECEVREEIEEESSIDVLDFEVIDQPGDEAEYENVSDFREEEEILDDGW